MLTTAGKAGSTHRPERLATMTSTDLTPTEACDLAALELNTVGGDEDHDIQVTFGVKELLVDIKQAVERAHDATKSEIQALERRLTDRIVLVDSAAKERAEGVEQAAKALAEANAQEISTLRVVVDELRLWKARVAGAAALAGVVGGALGAGASAIIGG
jgi:hypothetical protein